MMKIDDIRKLNTLDLGKKIQDKKVELATLKVEKGFGKLEKLNAIKVLKREIAKMLTIYNEKEAINE